MHRPTPTPADHAEALGFVAEVYDADPAVCRNWLANHREKLVRYAADAAMQKRQNQQVGRQLAAKEAAE